MKISKFKPMVQCSILISLLLTTVALITFSCETTNQSYRWAPNMEHKYYTEEVTQDMNELYSNNEAYENLSENDFKMALNEPLSTFSIDVDNASYSNIRRFLNDNMMPPPASIRIEEMINYFDYQYPDVSGKHPFSIYTEAGICPWNKEHQLVHIGIQGKRLDYSDMKPSNLVFLIDVSGSMSANNKLPLLKKSFSLLLDQLNEQDKIAIVVYAGAAGQVLSSTSAANKQKILRALDNLNAGGSTAGGAGIELAYKIAQNNFIEGGNNRVILATDGDFNVGTSNVNGLEKLITEKRKSGVYLTICGFGMGNYKDMHIERMTNVGNGNYFYIDNIEEAEKVFVKEMRANLFTLANDVKVQVEFNPSKVASYRLIGYENRVLNNEDFNNDKKDAGELGAGHNVTALYEIVPANKSNKVESNLRYTKRIVNLETDELLAVKFRYKPIGNEKSILINHKVVKQDDPIIHSDRFHLATTVAGFGLLLRKSKYSGNLTYEMIQESTKELKDKFEYTDEFAQLVNKAKLLSKDSVSSLE